ncbi:MAG: DMT family transporter [Lachnospiraceae bacterium]|nr:DMT family transporter [Lachnospiraceae bacterium]
MMDLHIGWLGYFLLAWVLFGFNFVLIKKGLEGMSGPMAVAIEAGFLFVIRLIVYGPGKFFSKITSYSPETWLRIFLFAAMIAVAWIAFFMSMRITSEIGVAPFYYLIFPVQMITGYIISRKLPDWQMIVILLLIIVGVFLMGFGRDHKHSLWWTGAIAGPVIIGLIYALRPVHFKAAENDEGITCFILLLVMIISVIAAMFMKGGDVKKVTVYHLIFIVLAGFCLYLAPVFEARATAAGSLGTLVTVCCTLWIIINLIASKFMLNEILSNVSAAGLGMIVIAYIWYYQFYLR